MKKLLLLAAGGVGYVLGARAGRARYDQIVRTVTKVKDDPRVQEKAQQAADYAQEKAPVVKDKVAGAASGAAEKVTGGSSDSSGSGGGGETTHDPSDGELNPDSIVYQDNPYPRGDLP